MGVKMAQRDRYHTTDTTADSTGPGGAETTADSETTRDARQTDQTTAATDSTETTDDAELTDQPSDATSQTNDDDTATATSPAHSDNVAHADARGCCRRRPGRPQDGR